MWYRRERERAPKGEGSGLDHPSPRVDSGRRPVRVSLRAVSASTGHGEFAPERTPWAKCFVKASVGIASVSSTFAGSAIAAKFIAVWLVARWHGGTAAGVPMRVISRVKRAGLTIETGSKRTGIGSVKVSA